MANFNEINPASAAALHAVVYAVEVIQNTLKEAQSYFSFIMGGNDPHAKAKTVVQTKGSPLQSKMHLSRITLLKEAEDILNSKQRPGGELLRREVRSY